MFISELWLEWVTDERTLLKEEESRDSIERIFKRALDDYQSNFNIHQYYKFFILVLMKFLCRSYIEAFIFACFCSCSSQRLIIGSILGHIYLKKMTNYEICKSLLLIFDEI